MASVFKRRGSKLYTAKVRAWNAALGKWVWDQQPTGQTDEAKAMGVAAVLEGVSAMAKAGMMTREKAMGAVNDILKLAGMDALELTPSLESIAEAILHDREITPGTYKKYDGMWRAFKEWAGVKIKRAADAWTAGDCVDYYRHLRAGLGMTTANQHLNFLSMLFERAIALGYRASNPTGAVERVQNEEVNKGTISRGEQAMILRSMRKGKRKDWSQLAALGWHSGHRIQDLLDTSKEKIKGDLITIKPRKKRGKASARVVVLPLAKWLARALERMGDFQSIRKADNHNGRISGDFIEWLKLAGIDPRPVQRKKRIVHEVSFHSYRHSLTSRLLGAGVSGEVARMVTDHESKSAHKVYQHAEIEALRTALRKAR
ncbi:MAG: integrase family protein [Verrucomicrobiaceae bacterium]|nr:integrase family protein [Verrucomicrobiaceae bacterium]